MLQSEAQHLHSQRARDREGSSETAWCVDYWQGECLGKGWRWRELIEANKPARQPNYTKTALFGLKITKMLFFTQKYFIRYTPKMFF
jgi:hypothetical protein